MTFFVWKYLHGAIPFDTAQEKAYAKANMKYVLLFALAVVIAKIDTVVKLYKKANDEVVRQTNKVRGATNTTDIRSTGDVISVAEDPTLRIDPHTKIISLMESYKLSPEPEIRLKIMEDIKIVPKMLKADLDPELEAAIYGWRDLLVNNHEDTILFLISLENLLQGENQIMVRRFFSLLMDKNLESFIKNYQKTKDVNCKAASYFAGTLPENEKLNEYRERGEALDAFLKKENLEASLKNYASICKLVIQSSMNPVEPAAVAPDPTLTNP